MKKCARSPQVAVLALAFAFSSLALGCPPPVDNPGGADPHFLVGTWRNANAVFTIDEDLTFRCRLASVSNPGGTGSGIDPGFVRGRLEAGGPLGAYSFWLRSMEVGGPDGNLYYPDESYFDGNDLLHLQVPHFNNISVTLTPNAAGGQFVFWSPNAAASMFFGAAGPFVKDD